MPTPRFALLIAFLLMPLVTSLGCSGEHTVTLKISGTSTSEEREKISEKAKSLIEGSSHYISSYHMNDSYTVNVGPVMDVDAFVKQIDFGKVTKVEDRTIYVDVNAKPDAEEPAATDPAPMETEPTPETPVQEAPMDASREEK
ncbi:hypothetical protein C5Y96_03385 [Blastopirellula marina]|uniref:Inhibitor I9 domain-containing protein n=1 Tax=Blastopirellula marina TaxID=124 RepID=A0A2S8G3B9_9BACT|nr:MULTISPECIES: hypothetical protein [Pirellulaceae]PQO38927.1 hypothetical protein C5Y96_03385 [Blastopirellula marina]RCS55235.1 hypothetical protein DTL36_03390 [Bremerella cremea]